MQSDADDSTSTSADADATVDDAASVDAATDDAVSADDAAAEENADSASADESSGVEGTAESSGVDTEHVMNLTFVLTLLFGVPAVVVLSLFVPLDGWGEILSFVVRVGAAIWFLTAVALYARERIRE